MNIQGLQKTTLLDFPGHVAATIFLGGCNFRCPFCHNMNLVLGDFEPLYSVEDIISFLKKRQGLLDGVCITGGEPTMYSDLFDFISTIKSLGYLIKLDTNGSNPDILSSLIGEGLIDYVAMDIKSSLSEYAKITGVPGIDTSKISKSVSILLSSSIPYEFRTTMIKEYHTPTIIDEMGKLVEGASNYYLQSFVDSEYVLDHSLSSFTEKELLNIKEQLSKYVSAVSIRGV